MTDGSPSGQLPRTGEPALVVRLFGWIMLALVAAFLIANVLIVGWDYPALGAISSGDPRAFVILAIYALCIALAVARVFKTSNIALRYEARQISDFNAYLIRGCYFAVLFVGIGDAVIALIRVEGALDVFFPEAIARGMARASWMGLWFHIPLLVLGFVVAAFSRSLGFIWLALLIVAAELLIVFSRFVFSYEQAFMGDLVRYWYAALFLFASAYTLLEEGHVRVDVLYANLGMSSRGKVNAFGAIFLGMTTSWIIILIGLSGRHSIINSPVANFEVSQSGAAGLFLKYQMAAFLAVFAVTMLIQFVSYLFEAVADTRVEPGHVDHDPVIS